MGTAKFSIPAELTSEGAGDIAKRVISGAVRILFNGQSDELVAKLETAELRGTMVGRGTGQYEFGFEFWSGKNYLGDVYLRANGKNSDVVVECTQVTPDLSDVLLQEYLK